MVSDTAQFQKYTQQLDISNCIAGIKQHTELGASQCGGMTLKYFLEQFWYYDASLHRAPAHLSSQGRLSPQLSLRLMTGKCSKLYPQTHTAALPCAVLHAPRQLISRKQILNGNYFMNKGNANICFSAKMRTNLEKQLDFTWKGNFSKPQEVQIPLHCVTELHFIVLS